MTSGVPLIEQDFPQQDLEDGSIVDVFMRNASWVWTLEPGLEPPWAPPNAQRVFRSTFSISTTALSSGKTPTSAAIIVAADNDFALYINGVLFRPADPQGIRPSSPQSPLPPWEFPKAFSLPIPQGIDKLVFAIRGINYGVNTGQGGNNSAGLKAAIRITHSDNSTEYLLTGQGRTWLGMSLYPEGWETPQFDDRDWDPVTVFPASVNDAPWGGLRRPSKIFVASVLPSDTSGPLTRQIVTTETALPSVGTVKGVSISGGGLAGMVIGIVLASAGLAVLLTCLVMRRRFRSRS